ncbi:hypothetical protein [Moritella sp. 28]|uniref:hypothetical protein n=1 Tax=Moritella sp. 28 TaxID=2746232 RepID=UPI001BA43CBA|nr:hypothetical protein [Moritella sp. 28]QUM84075.1 iron transporter [Moritella sp. 28]
MMKLKDYFNSHNGQVLQRIVAAVFLGYLVTNLLSILLAYLLPLPLNDAAKTATLSSFVIYSIIIMWCFTKKDIAKVWSRLLIVLAISALTIFLYNEI